MILSLSAVWNMLNSLSHKWQRLMGSVEAHEEKRKGRMRALKMLITGSRSLTKCFLLLSRRPSQILISQGSVPGPSEPCVIAHLKERTDA